MKLPSPTERKILHEVWFLWSSGQDIKARYVKKHGEIPNGTFYTMLRRLTESGWVKTRGSNPSTTEDQRQRYFATTAQTKKLEDALNQIHEALSKSEKLKDENI